MLLFVFHPIDLCSPDSHYLHQALIIPPMQLSRRLLQTNMYVFSYRIINVMIHTVIFVCDDFLFLECSLINK